jgi:hypothetical protein
MSMKPQLLVTKAGAPAVAQSSKREVGQQPVPCSLQGSFQSSSGNPEGSWHSRHLSVVLPRSPRSLTAWTLGTRTCTWLGLSEGPTAGLGAPSGLHLVQDRQLDHSTILPTTDRQDPMRTQALEETAAQLDEPCAEKLDPSLVIP